MANQVIGDLPSGTAGYVLPQSSGQLIKDTLGWDLLNYIIGAGCVNTDSNVLSKKGGDTVNFYNLNRINSNGLQDGVDMYANAQDNVYGNRDVVIKRIKYSHKVPKDSTMTQQRAYSSVGELENGVYDNLQSFAKGVLWHGLINQAAGNNATSIVVPRLATTAFTGNTLLHATGLNTPPAATAEFSGIGNLGAGGVSTPSNITSSNILTIQDFQAALTAIRRDYTGVTGWNTIEGKDCEMIALVSDTGFNQMMNQAPAAAANASISQETYSRLAGGEKPMMATGTKVNGFVEYRSAITPTIKYLVVPDTWLPQSVDSNAAVAQTRTAVILGANALDMAVGRAMDGSPGASFKIATDTEHEKLNDFDYYGLWLLFGIKKTQLNGFGLNSSNTYDFATYVINHYSAS